MMLSITTAIVIIAGVMLVIAIVFAGVKWVKPESLRLKVWNCLEFELRSPEQHEPPKRAIKRS